MMKFVNSTIEWAVVEHLMSDVVPGVFVDEEEDDLEDHCLDRWEGDLIG